MRDLIAGAHHTAHEVEPLDVDTVIVRVPGVVHHSSVGYAVMRVDVHDVTRADLPLKITVPTPLPNPLPLMYQGYVSAVSFTARAPL